MSPIHTILHPTDFSDRSQWALQLACALSRDYGARLILLHVTTGQPVVRGDGEDILPLDPGPLFQEAREKLNHLEVTGANVRAERRLEQGDPVSQILRAAKEINASLIVMGMHGRTGLRRLLMGSVAEQIVRKAPCPVLTVTNPLPDSEVPGVFVETSTASAM